MIASKMLVQSKTCHVLSFLTNFDVNIRKCKLKFWSIISYSAFDLKFVQGIKKFFIIIGFAVTFGEHHR